MVHIDCFASRSVDAKRALYRAIVERLGPIGIPPRYVSITVRDIPMSNWGSKPDKRRATSTWVRRRSLIPRRGAPG